MPSETKRRELRHCRHLCRRRTHIEKIETAAFFCAQKSSSIIIIISTTKKDAFSCRSKQLAWLNLHMGPFTFHSEIRRENYPNPCHEGGQRPLEWVLKQFLKCWRLFDVQSTLKWTFPRLHRKSNIFLPMWFLNTV